MSCTIEINGNPKLSKIITNLSYGSESQAVKLMQLVNTDEFKEYCKNDSVAKTDEFEKIPERTLNRLVRDFRASKVFSVNNNSSYDVSGNNYNFKDNKTRQDALQFTADLCYLLYYKNIGKVENKQQLVNLVRNSARNKFRQELVTRLNRYGANFNSKTTPLEDLYSFANNPANEVLDIDKNFADLVQTAYGDLNFWKEAFHNSKVVNLGMEIKDDKQNVDEDMMTDEETNSINDEESEYTVDEMTYLWSEGWKNNFNSHVSEYVRAIFNSLPKLSSTVLGTITDNNGNEISTYQYDRNNALGVIKYHTYQECAIEIAGLIERGAWKSVDTFINAIEQLANEKAEFAGFKKLADDMRNENAKGLAEAIYKDLNKYNVDVLEVCIDEYGNLVARQPNNDNNTNIQSYLEIRNDFKYSAINLNNADIEVELKDIRSKLDKARTSANIANQSKGVGVRRRSGQIVKTNIDVNPQTDAIRSILKLYFPSFDTGAYDRFIIQSNDRITALDQVLSMLEKVNTVAQNSAKEYANQKYEIYKANAENEARRKAALNSGADVTSIEEVEPQRIGQSYLIGADEVLANISKTFSPYSKSKAKLNYRNVNGNLQSGLINNNYITAVVKALSDPETLQLWVNEKLQNPTEYAYSPILIDRPDQGIKGIVRQNGYTWELTEYAGELIHAYLLSGISNMITGKAKGYTNMSDIDYLAEGFLTFKFGIQNYRKYRDELRDDTESNTAAYLMRTPSDAPKNFLVTLPKYGINDLYNIDRKAIKEGTKDRIKSINKWYNAAPEEIAIQVGGAYIDMSIDDAAKYILNLDNAYDIIDKKTVGNRKIDNGDDKKICIRFIDGDKYGYAWFNYVEDNNNYKLTYIGKQQNSDCNYYELDKAIDKWATNEYLELINPDARYLNHNSTIFNILRNIIYGEIKEHVEALEFRRTHPKEQWIDYYHDDNALHFSKLDNDIFNIDKALNSFLSPSSTGGLPVIIYNTGVFDNVVEIIDRSFNDAIEDAIEQWMKAYMNFSIQQFVGETFEEYTNNDFIEYMFNAYIANISFDDLFEGNSKFYKNGQTFLKRTKQVQAGGTSYAYDYRKTTNNINPYIQSISETGDSIIVGGRTINMRSGWNAITIHNSVRGSDNATLLKNQLLAAGLSEDKANALVLPFKTQFLEKGDELDTSADNTKVNDAQSYVTIYEYARRLKLLGEYDRYKDLLDKLTDNTTNINEIDASKLAEFIQVAKNFYYDQYYDSNLRMHVSRQIKNAEFVLIPKFLGHYENGQYVADTSLGTLCQIMLDSDIQQVNTIETSKAANYETLTFWDNEGVAISDLNKFAEDAKRVKKPYSYAYLYRQQEVPQHIKDEENKAGIQIMKKVIDNLSYASDDTKDAGKELMNVYVENIRQTFNELMEKYGIRFDEEGNIKATNGRFVDYTRIYNLALTEMARLGLDSNKLDYVTIKNRTSRTVMPALFNIVGSKTESIAQSLFNKYVTRQKLPGWHAAQVTGVGLEGKIPQIGISEYAEKTGNRIQLNYHKEDNVVDVLLPKWASTMFNQYDEKGNLIKEINIEDVDDEVKMQIGYRIPTEGKQSIAVLRVVGFLPEWMGSTVVVPDEWVTQTGSDFDVDSIYGIAYETYIGHDGKVHKVEYIDGQSEESKWVRYAKYVNREATKLIKQENSVYMTDEDKIAYKEQARKFLEEQNKDIDTFYDDISKILNEKENDAYAQLTDEQKEELTPIFKDKSIKFKDRVAQVIDKLRQWNIEQNNDGVESMLEVYTEIRNIINAQIDYNQQLNEDIYSMLVGEYKRTYQNAIRNRAKAAGAMTFEEFTSQSIAAQNTRQARNNRILEQMLKIMNSKDATEENLSRSNFDDIEAAIRYINEKLGITKSSNCVYNPITQLRFRRNAMSGAMLKAFSVTRDTANSVFNVIGAVLNTPIYIKYNFDVANEKGYGAKRKDAEAAFNVTEDGWIKHQQLANSANGHNVNGEWITVASSHTTAHILDAIKSGAIPNENEFTFAAMKTLFDVGADAFTVVKWLNQPGITRIVNSYFESNSVFTRGKYNPIHTAIKRAAKELDIKVNKQDVTDYTNINDVLDALQNQYGVDFKALTGGEFSFDRNNVANRIDVSKIDSRGFETATDTDQILMDIAAIIQFSYINDISKAISNHARVLNPDRFGAKQTIYGTRKVFQDIIKLEDTNLNNTNAIKIKAGNGKWLLESIYPGVEELNTERGLKKFIMNTASSSYPSLNAFLKYSTAPSILINSGLFETERVNFVNAVSFIGDLVSGGLNESLYNDFKAYVLDYLYKSQSIVIEQPVTLDKNNKIVIDADRGSSPVEGGITPQDAERNRIYGYGYNSRIDFNTNNVNKPTEEEIKQFVKLTPAQKVLWVQQHLDPDEKNIFSNYKVNVYNENEVRYNKGVSRHIITFNDQQQDMEDIYNMFAAAYFSKNPLIKLTALDIIKYAFVVEGFRFKRNAVGKTIKNNTLYTNRTDGGTGIVDDILAEVNNINIDILTDDKVYTDYFRSHSTIEQIPSYRIKYTRNSEGRNTADILPIAKTTGLIAFDLETKKGLENAIKTGVVKEYHTSDGRAHYAIATHFVNLIKAKNKSQLYKIVLTKGEDANVKEIHLIPLNKLETNEHGKFSANSNNNKLPSENYYHDLISLRQTSGLSFRELADSNNPLLDKNSDIYKQYKYNKPKREKNAGIPNDENFVINAAKNEGAARQFMKSVNSLFTGEQQLESGWIWNASPALKSAFSKTGKEAIINIPDDKGIINQYIVKRVTMRPRDVKFNHDDARTKAIEDAFKNGVTYLDTLYYVQVPRQPNLVKAKSDSVGMQSSLGGVEAVAEEDVNTTNVDEMTELAQDFILDMTRRVRFDNDTESAASLRNIHRKGVRDNLLETIDMYKSDTISEASKYYSYKANELIERMENFFVDENGEVYDMMSDYVLNRIKTDEKLLNDFIDLTLAASTFSDNFDVLFDIDLGNLENNAAKINLINIRETAIKLKNNPVLRKAMDKIADTITEITTKNPVILAGLSSGSTNINKDFSFLDRAFQSAREIPIPVVQAVLKRAVTHVNARNLEGRKILIDFNARINDIQTRARNNGKSINIHNVVSDGKFTTNFNEEFLKDKRTYQDTVDDMQRAYGHNSKEYLIAKHAQDKFLLDNVHRPLVKSYYEEMYNNDEIVLNDETIDYYIEYLKLVEERNKILNISRNNRTPEQLNRLTSIRNKIADMRSATYIDGEPKSDKNIKLANRLDTYLKVKNNIRSNYFKMTPRANFQKELEHNLAIIRKHRKFNSDGSPLFTEDGLASISEYVQAVNWIEENTIYGYDEDSRAEINNMFALLRAKNVVPKDRQFRNILRKIDEPYDNNGVINGLKFNDRQIEYIKQEQEQSQNKGTADGGTGLLKLIRNRQDDQTIYSEAFYKKFRLGQSNISVEERNAVISKINGILVDAIDQSTGKIWLSRLSTDQLRELEKLYDELGDINNDINKPQEYINFMKNDVSFKIDTKQYLKDYAEAKDKVDRGDANKEWLTAFRRIAAARSYEHGTLSYNLDNGNSMIYGYVAPRKKKDGSYVNPDYYSAARDAAIQKLRNEIRFIPTKYYYEARNKAIEEGRLKEWEKANHYYNKYTNKLEPIRIWTEMEILTPDVSKEYLPNYDNLNSEAYDIYKNDKYVKNGVNYNTDGHYTIADQANEYEKELRNYLLEVYNNLTKNNPSAAKYYAAGLTPRRRVRNENNFKDIIKALGNFFGYASYGVNDGGLSRNTGYAHRRHTNIPMLEQLKSVATKPYEEVRDQGLEESDEDYAKYRAGVRERNRKIAEENREIEKKLMDDDIIGVFQEFIPRAIDANAKAETALELYFLTDYLQKYYEVYDTNGIGNLKRDGIKSTDDRTVYTRKHANNTIHVLNIFINRFLNDEYKGYHSLNNLASILQNITSAKFMMMNLTGGIGNVLTGGVNIFMERLGDEFFNHKDWETAKFSYYVPNVLSGFLPYSGSETTNNLIDGIIKLMNIVDYSSVQEMNNGIDYKNVSAVIDKLKNLAYSPQTAGEHFMQNTAMLAMMISNRIVEVNGKKQILDYRGYMGDIERKAMLKVLEKHPELEKLYKKFINREKRNINRLKNYHWFKEDINTTFIRSISNKEIGFEFNRIRNEMMKNARKEFEQMPKLIDQFELKQGYCQLKEDSGITYRDLGEFKDKVAGVNERIHGIYDKLGAASIETTEWWGSLVMQFHKHIYNGFLKRFRINGYFNERRENIERGCYITLWNFASCEFKDLIKRVKERKDETGEAGFILGVQKIGRSLINTYMNFKFNYATMTTAERANLRRCLGDLYGVVQGLVLGLAASCLLAAGDDDDDVLAFAGSWMLYQADRLSSDSLMYLNPIGEAKKQWSNPVVIGSSIKDMMKATSWAIQWMVQGDEFNPLYTTGQFAGENKIEVYIKRQIPIYRTIDRLLRMEDSNSYYKLDKNFMQIIPIEDVANWIVGD